MKWNEVRKINLNGRFAGYALRQRFVGTHDYPIVRNHSAPLFIFPIFLLSLRCYFLFPPGPINKRRVPLRRILDHRQVEREMGHDKKKINLLGVILKKEGILFRKNQ